MPINSTSLDHCYSPHSQPVVPSSCLYPCSSLHIDCVCPSNSLFYLPCSIFICPQLTPEEEEKRRVRRERNKLAAAKCRNRRRELTEMLQGVSRNLKTGATRSESVIEFRCNSQETTPNQHKVPERRVPPLCQPPLANEHPCFLFLGQYLSCL